jgi:hypothetical protein
MDLLSLWVGLPSMKEQMEGQGHQIYPLIILQNSWAQNQFGLLTTQELGFGVKKKDYIGCLKEKRVK